MERVLVVDDEEDILVLIRVNLELDGFEVHAARSGEDALEMARQLRPDYVLVDWMMPGKDGLEVCRHLRAHPATQDTTIVVFSAKVLHQEEDRAMAAGADAFVARPFRLDDLAGALRQARMARTSRTSGVGAQR